MSVLLAVSVCHPPSCTTEVPVSFTRGVHHRFIVLRVGPLSEHPLGPVHQSTVSFRIPLGLPRLYCDFYRGFLLCVSEYPSSLSGSNVVSLEYRRRWRGVLSFTFLFRVRGEERDSRPLYPVWTLSPPLKT